VHATIGALVVERKIKKLSVAQCLNIIGWCRLLLVIKRKTKSRRGAVFRCCRLVQAPTGGVFVVERKTKN
jgi:hypothetical protein